MRLVIIINLFPPKWMGGTEKATYNIAKYLVKRGNEVHIITTLDEGLPELSIESGFFIHRLYIRRIFGSLFILWYKTVKEIIKINPSIILVQSIQMGIPALILKTLFKMSYVVYGRGSDVYIHINKRLWLILSIIILNNANTVIVLTNDMKNKLKRLFHKNILIIPNGVEFENYRNIPREQAKLELNIDVNKYIILSVANLRPEKRIDILIKGMIHVLRELPNSMLYLVGDGPDKNKLESITKKYGLTKNIVFCGRINHKLVSKYLASADVFVLTSSHEGLPNAVLEALAAGIAVVATKVGGLPELITNGVNGFLVNPDDIPIYILKILKNKSLNYSISKNNIKDAKKYNWENTTEKIEEILNNSARKHFIS